MEWAINVTSKLNNFTKREREREGERERQTDREREREREVFRSELYLTGTQTSKVALCWLLLVI